MPGLLLDTCALIWLGNDDPIDENARARIAEAVEQPRGVLVSAISAWEIGMLVSRGRVALSTTPEAFYGAALAVPGVVSADLSPEVLIASSFLPGTPPRDPADRILVATARLGGLTIVTRDRLILDYAGKGHLRALEC